MGARGAFGLLLAGVTFVTVAGCARLESGAPAPPDDPTTASASPAPRAPRPECYGLNEYVEGPPRTIETVMTVTHAVIVGDVVSIEAGMFNTRDGQPPDPRRPRGPSYNPGVVTPINVQVHSSIEGDEHSGTIRVVIEGGAAGCIVHRVDNAPRLERGKRYALFLQPSKDAGGVRHPELPGVIVGWPVDADGLVQTEEDGVLTLDEFEAKVRGSR